MTRLEELERTEIKLDKEFVKSLNAKSKAIRKNIKTMRHWRK